MSDRQAVLEEQTLNPNTSTIPPSAANAIDLLEAATAPLVPDKTENPPTKPAIRFPPFPEVPEGANVMPFKDFQEHGILIFCEEDVETDGLGIPTIPLRVPHDTDVRKTKKAKPKVIRSDGEEEDDADEEDSAQASSWKKKKKGKGRELDENEKLDPVARAQEQRRQRMLMFQKTEWYNHWALGEDLRGMRTYDQNMSPVDRIHISATEFRTGRIWPPGTMRVNYLWDQFRLYTGLLGSPPVWQRVDVAQPEEDEDEYDDDDIPPQNRTPSKRKPKDDPDSDSYDPERYSDEDDEDEFESETESNKRQKAQDEPDFDDEQQNSTQVKRKRIPPRTPYALFNVKSVPLSSDEQVTILLRLAAQRRDEKLLKFLADPDYSTRVFLSWYLRQEGFIWTPVFLVNFPHLVSFFLAFMLRAHVLPESDRALKRAVAVAQKAIDELPKTTKLCRLLPDKMGVGSKGIWGSRWLDEWDLAKLNSSAADETPDPQQEETEEEALKRFEEELKAANVQLMSADPDELGAPSFELTDIAEETIEEHAEIGSDGYLASQLVELDDGSESNGAYIEGVASVDGQLADIEEPELPVNGGNRTEIEVRDEVKSPSSPGQKENIPDNYVPPQLASIDQGADTGKNASVEDAGSFEDRLVAFEAMMAAALVGSPTLPPDEQSTATRRETSIMTVPSEPAQSTPVHTAERLNWAVAPDEPVVEPESDDDMNDWLNAGGSEKRTPAEREAKKLAQAAAWAPSMEQPLTELFGMSVFPLRFEAGGHGATGGVGVAERSVRKINTLIPAGELEKDKKWRGVEEELVRKLARVVLAPWKEWDDGGTAPDYRTPKVQGPSLSTLSADGAPLQVDRRAAKYAHDPLEDDITVLVEPHIAEQMSVGMGLAGTWVQLVPVRDESYMGSGGRGRGRGRGRGGRGRGTGRGGSTVGAGSADGRSTAESDAQTGLGDAPSSGAGRSTHRGRGGGRGSPAQSGATESSGTQKEFTFWYIEDVYMAVPSFWTVGEDEPPLDLTELGEEVMVAMEMEMDD